MPKCKAVKMAFFIVNAFMKKGLQILQQGYKRFISTADKQTVHAGAQIHALKVKNAVFNSLHFYIRNAVFF